MVVFRALVLVNRPDALDGICLGLLEGVILARRVGIYTCRDRDGKHAEVKMKRFKVGDKDVK